MYIEISKGGPCSKKKIIRRSFIAYACMVPTALYSSQFPVPISTKFSFFFYSKGPPRGKPSEPPAAFCKVLQQYPACRLHPNIDKMFPFLVWPSYSLLKGTDMKSTELFYKVFAAVPPAVVLNIQQKQHISQVDGAMSINNNWLHIPQTMSLFIESI